MKTVCEFQQVARRTSAAMFVTVAMLSAAGGSSAAAAAPAAPAPSAPAATAPQFMFVQIAEDLKVDPVASTIRLRNVGQQTIYFSDRPVRMAGHVKMSEYLWQWTPAAGKNNFSSDPPNATLSVYEPGQTDNKVAILTISNPKVDGTDLVYNYKIVEGKIPTNGGATSLFIDMVGVGGGVGVGFHGVGVGARGVGVR